MQSFKEIVQKFRIGTSHLNPLRVHRSNSNDNSRHRKSNVALPCFAQNQQSKYLCRLENPQLSLAAIVNSLRRTSTAIFASKGASLNIDFTAPALRLQKVFRSSSLCPHRCLSRRELPWESPEQVSSLWRGEQQRGKKRKPKNIFFTIIALFHATPRRLVAICLRF